jgi:REP element-mobilizing transposase RayT
VNSLFFNKNIEKEEFMEENKFYHIYNRGNNRELIFFEVENYRFFLERFQKYLKNFVDVYAYCLMPNHFHFLISLKNSSEIANDANVEINVEKGFKNMFISYAKSINKRYHRTGSLFQNSYKKKEINKELYFKNLVQYIHQNPVRASICKQCSEWKYSSYNDIIGHSKTIIEKEYILNEFGGKENFVYMHKVLVNGEF